MDLREGGKGRMNGREVEDRLLGAEVVIGGSVIGHVERVLIQCPDGFGGWYQVWHSQQPPGGRADRMGCPSPSAANRPGS
jgi:hypothetical protein